jgi:hypothetical protein
MANLSRKSRTETVSNWRAGCIERMHVRFGKGWSETYLQRQRAGHLLHMAKPFKWTSQGRALAA